MLNSYLYFSDKKIKKDNNVEPVDIKITDILTGGQKIAGDWLEKEVLKRLDTHRKSEDEETK